MAWVLAVVAVLALGVEASQARLFARNRPVGAGGTVQLPYTLNDAANDQWMIYDGGWCRQNNNQPVYQQAAMLMVNNNQANGNNNTGTLDAKTGELVLTEMNLGNVSVTRRIAADNDDNFIRYVDVFKNTTNQAQTVNVQLSATMNFGMNGQAGAINDPKHKDVAIGWVGMTGCNRAGVEMYGGKGCKTVPAVQYAQGNNMVQAMMTLNIPAGKSQAIMHLHTTANSYDQGLQFITNLKENQLMRSLPADIRHLIVNFSSGNNFVGEYEILRGDTTDVVELRTGDQLRGTIKDADYKLTTFYGQVNLPNSQVIGMINVGQFRPRQLVVTTDGQIFGGKLERDVVALELSSGQVTQIPVAQINRLGYRKRANEPEDWTFDKPFVLMRTGDRVAIAMPTAPVDVHTRYGEMKLDPASVASIAFQSEDNGVHEVYLTDGSKFAGLVSADQFDMKLADGTQVVKFPTNSVVRLQLSSKVADEDDAASTVSLSNEDQMVGTLTGGLKFDTAFDTITLEGEQIRHLTHVATGSTDMQVTLWDNTTLSGQFQQSEIDCKLVSGSTVKLPLALISEYNQPLPIPSAATLEKIKAAVADLNADDWKQRDKAEQTLVAYGAAVIKPLLELKPTQPPEAQQRIDSVIKTLKKQGAATPGASVAPPPGPGGLMPMPFNGPAVQMGPQMNIQVDQD